MRVALVIGASRGMGKQAAVTLAENGYAVGVAAKTTEHSQKTPGTIYDVCEEIKAGGGKALPIKCNVRELPDIDHAVQHTLDTYGRLDFVMYNAGAILWEPVKNTPLKRLDLMWEVNLRGAYSLVQKVLPYFLERQSGNILLVSPPIYSRFFKCKAPYSVTKMGLSILVNGMAHELQNTGVNVSSLWPATATSSHVTNVMGVSEDKMRKPTLFADACVHIANEQTDRYNGKILIDEDMLRDLGVRDFSAYRCNPDVEPPRMMPKHFPSLTVEEEQEDSIPDSKL